MNDDVAALAVADEPDWAPVRDAMASVDGAMAMIGQLAKEQLFPRALLVGQLLDERRQCYPAAGAFHDACQTEIGLSRSSAEAYLQVWRARDQLQAAIDAGAHIASTRAALALLRTPRPEPALSAAVVEAMDVDVEPAPLPVVLTDGPNPLPLHGVHVPVAGDLLQPLRQAAASLDELMAHPQLQGRPDLIGRLNQLAEVMAAIERSVSAALRPAAPVPSVEQLDLLMQEPASVDATNGPVERNADATDALLSAELNLPIEAEAIDHVAAQAAAPDATSRYPLADRYPVSNPVDALQRLTWDADRAGGMAALGVQLNCSRQAVHAHRARLERAVARQQQQPRAA